MEAALGEPTCSHWLFNGSGDVQVWAGGHVGDRAAGILGDAVPKDTAPVLKGVMELFGSNYSCVQPGSHFSKYISGY